MPLGFVLHPTLRTIPRAYFIGLALSTLIEACQLALPGRYPSLADLFWNSAGAALGVVAFRVVRARATGEDTRARFGTFWAVGTVVLVLSAGYLLKPVRPIGSYWGERTPSLSSMPRYGGLVEHAELNGQPLPTRYSGQPPIGAEDLQGEWSISMRVIVGGPSRALSPILVVRDREYREIVLLGAQGDDFVFRDRTLARRLGLDSPDLRLRGAFGSRQPGDTVTVDVRAGREFCIRLDRVDHCGLGVTPSRTWSFLLYPESAPEPARRLLDVLWIAALLAPIGYFARSWAELCTMAALTFGGAALAVGLTPLISPSGVEALAALSGLFIGRGLAWLVVSRHSPALRTSDISANV